MACWFLAGQNFCVSLCAAALVVFFYFEGGGGGGGGTPWWARTVTIVVVVLFSLVTPIAVRTRCAVTRFALHIAAIAGASRTTVAG